MLSLVGCSGGGIDSPTSPIIDSSLPQNRILDSSHRSILAVGNIQIDESTLTASFIPNREAAKHWDVTPLLQPPNCDDCVSIEVLEFKPAQKYVKLKIRLKNPSTLTGFDVRGIAMVPSADVRLLNSDGWTELWDDGGDVSRNPFKSFATDWPEREFEPGTSHARVYEFSYKNFLEIANETQLIIDASWPGHCREAYAFDNVQQTGWIDADTSSADFSVSLTPQDWQGNISTVLIDLSEIGGGIEPMVGSGNDYTFAYQTSVVVPDAPRANIWVEVVDEINPVRAFWLYEIGIVNENPLLPIPTGLYASPGQVFVDLSWDAIDDPDVAGVNIYRRGKNGGYDFGSPVNPSPIAGIKFKDNDVSRNVMYFYTARAVGLDNSLGPQAGERGSKPFEWGEPFQLSDLDGITSTTPQAAVAPDGRTHVYWYDLRNGLFSNKTLFYDIVEENSSPDIDVLSLASYEPDFSQGNGRMFISWDNRVHIMFAGTIEGNPGGSDLLYLWFDDYNDPSYPLTIDEIPSNSVELYKDQSSLTHMLFYNWDPNLFDVYPVHQTMTPDFEFSEQVPLPIPEHDNIAYIRLAVDQGGEFHIVFAGGDAVGPSVSLFIYHEETIGGTWQQPEVIYSFIDATNATILWPRINIDSDGRLVVSFGIGSLTAGGFYIAFKDQAGSWSDANLFYKPTDVTSQDNGYGMSMDEDGVVNFIFGYLSDELRYIRWYDEQISNVEIITEGHSDPNLGTNRTSITSRPDGVSTAVWIDRKHQDGDYGSAEIWACQMLD